MENLGIFVSMQQKSSFMYYQRLIEEAIALKLKASGLWLWQNRDRTVKHYRDNAGLRLTENVSP